MDRPALRLHVQTQGRDPGPHIDTIVMLHGYGASSYTWRYWAPELAKHAHVVLVDLKGFGGAPKPADDRYGIEDQAELVLRLIVERDYRRVILVGHSLGGAIALRTALHLVDEGAARLARMILVGAAAYPQPLPPFVALAKHRRTSLALFRLIGPRRVIRWVLRSIVHDRSSVTEEQVRAYADPLASSEACHALVETALRIVPRNADAIIARFGEIDVPMLLLWGAQDRVVPPWVGHKLEADLPSARLHTIEACGHMPPEERPEETLALVRDFLSLPAERAP